uniref:Uncharacterized protein n=1 Tax=Lactuca sativa TaxID=4236 RepID=A0A9R1XNQ6_LACSA|nr:hypothetical protein LSAT_V11C200092990 [Lactuca sativa]
MNEAKAGKVTLSPLDQAATTCNVDDSECQASHKTPRNYELDMKIKGKSTGQLNKVKQVKAWARGLLVILLVSLLANEKQLVDHYSSKHPKEKPPACKWGFVLSVFLFHLHDDDMSSVSFALTFL